ncbi:PilW family protein [Marinobacteraceae bacterium S3BR75-40.1]
MRHPLSRQQGLSIIELMIAITLGLILTVGLTQIFVSNRQTFDVTEARTRVQEAGRMAVEMLNRAVRNADYWGCSSLSSGNVVNNLDPGGTGFDSVTLGFGDGLEGADDNTNGSDAIRDGTDSFTIRGVRGAEGVEIVTPMTQASAVLRVNEPGPLQAGDIVFISNCNGGDIFQASGVTGTTGNTNIGHNTGNMDPGNFNPSNPGCPGSNAHCLSQVYDEGAKINLPYYEAYYVGTGLSGEPALFMSRAQMSGGNIGVTQEIELIEGVEDMQILYGEDTDGDGTVNAWRDADAVADMNAVLAMRISLLVRSPQEDVFDTPQEYTFNGSTVTASDNRLRSVYTSTATIRNRM